MGVIKKGFLSGILALSLSVAYSFAADLPIKAPAYAPPPPPSWTGIYIGGSLGAQWTDSLGSVTSGFVGTAPNPPILSGGGNSLDSTAFRPSVFGGWNWEVARQFVLGIEGDAGWTDKTATRFGSPYPSDLQVGTITFPGPFPLGGSQNDSFSVHTTWDSSLRLRAGWLASPTALLYATGGIAWLHLEAISNCATSLDPVTANCAPGNFFDGTLAPAAISNSQTLTGWTIGGGVEVMLAPHWLARAEYRFADFGTATFTDVRINSGGAIGVPTSEASPLSISYSLREVTQIATIGLAYKFGD
jgi:outer membrane immunogenic protein